MKRAFVLAVLLWLLVVAASAQQSSMISHLHMVDPAGFRYFIVYDSGMTSELSWGDLPAPSTAPFNGTSPPRFVTAQRLNTGKFRVNCKDGSLAYASYDEMYHNQACPLPSSGQLRDGRFLVSTGHDWAPISLRTTYAGSGVLTNVSLRMECPRCLFNENLSCIGFSCANSGREIELLVISDTEFQLIWNNTSVSRYEVANYRRQ